MAPVERTPSGLPRLLLEPNYYVEDFSGEVFGIPRSYIFVHPKDKRMTLEEDFRHWWAGLVLAMDSQITNPAEEFWLGIGRLSPRQLFEEVRTAEQAERQKEGVRVCLRKILGDDKNAFILAPMYGALPALKPLEEGYGSRIYPVAISASGGTQTSEARIEIESSRKEVIDAIEDKSRTLIVFDDVVDGVNTLKAVVGKRAGIEVGEFEDYEALVEQMRANNIIIAAVYQKNSDFYKALAVKIGEIKAEGNAESGKAERAQRQAELIEAIEALDKEQWVVGAGMLDALITGEELIEEWRELGAGDPEGSPPLIEDFKNLRFRIGASIESLLALKGRTAEEREANRKLLIKKFVVLLRNRVRLTFKLQTNIMPIT